MNGILLNLILMSTLAVAAIPSKGRNGVIHIGESLSLDIDTQNTNSAFSRCQNESRGTRFFSNSCTKLIETLQKKMSMMSLESDLQMQAERLKVSSFNELRNERIAMLAKINLLSHQAEEALKSLKTGQSGGDNQERIPEIIPTVKKVQTAYEAYLKFLPHGQI